MSTGHGNSYELLAEEATMTTTPGPRTEAGKRLLAAWWRMGQNDDWRDAILAIEAEARADVTLTGADMRRIEEQAREEARADVDGLRDHVAALQSELRDLLAERREARMEVEVASRADVDGLVAQLQKAARLVVGYGVGNLTGPKYHARVAAFDELDDALEALAGDKAEAPE